MPPYKYSQLVDTIHSEDKPKDRASWPAIVCGVVLAVFIGAGFAYYF